MCVCVGGKNARKKRNRKKTRERKDAHVIRPFLSTSHCTCQRPSPSQRKDDGSIEMLDKCEKKRYLQCHFQDLQPPFLCTTCPAGKILLVELIDLLLCVTWYKISTVSPTDIASDSSWEALIANDHLRGQSRGLNSGPYGNPPTRSISGENNVFA